MTVKSLSMPEFTTFVQRQRFVPWYTKATVGISPQCVVLNHSSNYTWQRAITKLNPSQYELVSRLARIRFSSSADYDHAVLILFSESSAISSDIWFGRVLLATISSPCRLCPLILFNVFTVLAREEMVCRLYNSRGGFDTCENALILALMEDAVPSGSTPLLYPLASTTLHRRSGL